ncbi:MAG TPA: ABC transporter permease [Alphaproteobacteria bacterium]|nr:ABC transporter permease [Alphaproteobacteria bacterium]
MTLWRYILHRLLQAIVTLFAVISLMWGMFRLIPGDPTTVFLGTGELPPAAIAALKRSWGLDEPLSQQYLHYIGNLLTGNLGTSFFFRRPVLDVLLPMLLNTVLLMGVSMALAMLIGIIVGAYLGWKRGQRVEAVGSLLVLIPRSLPIFWIGIMLLMAFSYGLHWFPIGGISTPAFIPESALEALPGYDLVRHMILPVLTAVIYFVSDPLMIMRTSMLDVVEEDFITFARARGLPDRTVRRMARRNAIRPVLTYIAIMVSFALGGQVLLEVVFSWPGMGSLMVNSVAQRDYPVAQAAFFLMAVIVVLLNLAIDVLYVFLDPRIRYE